MELFISGWSRKKSPRSSFPRMRESPAAGLISLDSRFRGNDTNRSVTFYEFSISGWTFVVCNRVLTFGVYFC